MAQPDGGAKLWAVLEPHMRALTNELKEHNTALAQSILLALGRQETETKVIVKLLEDGIKPKARTKKVDAAPVDAVPAAGTAAVTAPAGAAAPPKRLANNSFNHFTAKFKEDAAFRESFLAIPALKELMDKEESIVKKKTAEDKIAPQGKFAWNWIKTGAVDKYNAVVAEYDELKAKHTEAAKPSPQVKEAATPPEAAVAE